jgi:hypothetical protein
MSGMDSGHWYRRDGSPCYEIPTKDGGVRGVNLRWDRPLCLVPSVTTVLQVVAKPQLEIWKVKQGILAALTLPRDPDETDDAYLARVLTDSREQAKAAAEEGTRIHDAIECAFKGKMYPPKYRPHVDAVMLRIGELFPSVTDWVSEQSFACPHGFGGKVDLHSPSTGIVVDYKGKDGDFSDGKRLHYDQHYQLAAYQDGLGLARNVSANIFVSRTHPGCVAHHVWTKDEIAYGWEFFRCALALWKCAKRYEPAFTIEEAA